MLASTKLSTISFVSESVSPLPPISKFKVLSSQLRTTSNSTCKTLVESVISEKEIIENFNTPSATRLSLMLKKVGENPFVEEIYVKASGSKLRTKSPAPNIEFSSRSIESTSF